MKQKAWVGILVPGLWLPLLLGPVVQAGPLFSGNSIQAWLCQMDPSGRVVGRAIQRRYTKLEEAIIDAEAICSLDLVGMGLEQLSGEIGKFRNLHRLWLGRNSLSRLPPEIGELTQLHDLDLSRNQFERLPDEIAKLTKLCDLNLEFNPLPQEERERLLALLPNAVIRFAKKPLAQASAEDARHWMEERARQQQQRTQGDYLRAVATARDILRRAHEEERYGRWDKAIGLYQNVVREYPSLMDPDAEVDGEFSGMAMKRLVVLRC